MKRERIEKLLSRSIGLDPASIGTQAIDVAVRGRMRARRITDLATYCDLVENDCDEQQDLLEGIVVSETWFFRDPEVFRFLVDHVMRRLDSGVSRVRIASIPCATGEEPYSVVMALLDAGASPARIEVRAADVSARAIEAARAGVFGANSFRGKDLAFRERWFTTSGPSWRIDPSVQACVCFEVGNALGPGFELGVGTCDAILCRNLLIYLDLESRRKLLGRLERALSPGGVLITGHSEDIAAIAPGFRRSGGVGAFAYLRSEPGTVEPAPISSVHCEPVTRAVAEPSPVATSEPSADAFCLLGVTLRSNGKIAEAAACFERALYLEHDHYDALVHFALLCEHRGESQAAARLRRRAARVSRNGVGP